MVSKFFGAKISQPLIVRLSKKWTTTMKGIPTGAMEKIADELGLSHTEKKNASFRDISFFLEKDIPVIVNYIEPSHEDGHYAVVVGLDRKNIILNDPWNGKGFALPRKFFMKRWHGKYEKTKRWMLAIWEK